MSLEPWYKVVTPREEVREGRSFNPDEFAIALEQVVSGRAPADYREPAKFFARTYFSRALTEHTGMVLRRLAGETSNTSPVMTLVTQFGGGKTHTLTTLLHLVRAGAKASAYPGIAELLEKAPLSAVPSAKVAVFVGNAWDPTLGRETPWLDVAHQLAGEAGIRTLGPAATTTPPGTDTLARLFEAADAPVLVLFDEVLNFMNRHRGMAEHFHAFIQNLTVAMTGMPRGAAVISLPRSQVEMTPWDEQWQDRITKVVRRTAKDLIANDEAEISEVVRRRLFEKLGDERVRRRVAKAYADWCFERRDRLPAEWMAVDTATTEAKARDFLQSRFESCYPFHPATLSVFQRKWQVLPQYQQTRGTLAMLAQWISWAQRDGYAKARTEPLVTLGSAPLHAPEFRGVVLGQLGDARLIAALDTDLAGDHAHARALDVDTKGALKAIHTRVGSAVLFESSGGQVQRIAHLPELRFAIGEPDVETTSVDNAAIALEQRAYYVRRQGDGYAIGSKPTLKKVVSDKRASLDDERDVRPALEALIKAEFERGRSVPLVYFPTADAEVPDAPRLTMVVGAPDEGWNGGAIRERVAAWTRARGKSQRLYPGALVWCMPRASRVLRDKVEMAVAWKRVRTDVEDGTIGGDYDKADRAELTVRVKEAEDAARDEVWAAYRFVVVAESAGKDGLKEIDLGAGHASQGETLTGRALAALKAEGLLNEGIGAGYLERNWPVALKESGAWPLSGLRQAFLDGSLTRLADPDAVLRRKIVEFVARGDFGLASGAQSGGGYERTWFKTILPPDEVSFEAGVVLVTKAVAARLTEASTVPAEPGGATDTRTLDGETATTGIPEPQPQPQPGAGPTTVRVSGEVPSELWNKIGTRLLPKLRNAGTVRATVSFEVEVATAGRVALLDELRNAIEELGVADRVRCE
jgi:hypothetical protein